MDINGIQIGTDQKGLAGFTAVQYNTQTDVK